MRRALLYVGGWLLAVVVATGVGFAAISLVGDDVGAPGKGVALVASPLATRTSDPDITPTSGPSATPVRSEPASSSDDPSDPNGSGSTSAVATQVTDAGSVTGLCRSEVPRLVSWSPKNGWSVVDVDGSGTRRHVTFSDGATYVSVGLRCVAGTPTFAVVRTDASPSPEPSATTSPTPSETASIDPA